MSEWHKIEDSGDVTLSDDGKLIEVYIGGADWGSQYIEIPVEFIEAILNARKN